jgi:Spy/CpxP family protein refolding chaperone
MKLHWAVGFLCVMFVAMTSVRAEDKPAAAAGADAKPAAAADAKPDKKPSGRLTMPWSKLTSLSDEQKTQIKAIHVKANEEIKAIQEKERADIFALLSDEQKSEVKSLEEKSMADKKVGAAAKKEDSAASAAPAAEKKDAEAAK